MDVTYPIKIFWYRLARLSMNFRIKNEKYQPILGAWKQECRFARPLFLAVWSVHIEKRHLLVRLCPNHISHSCRTSARSYRAHHRHLPGTSSLPLPLIPPSSSSSSFLFLHYLLSFLLFLIPPLPSLPTRDRTHAGPIDKKFDKIIVLLKRHNVNCEIQDF